MRCSHLAVALASSLLVSAPGTQTWQAPPANVRADVGKLAPALQQAMNSGRLEQVDAVVAQMRQALGQWAGHTEVETKYEKPIDRRSPPSLSEVRVGWTSLFSATEVLYKGNGRWGNGSLAPLRESCYILLGYSDAAKAGAGDEVMLRQRIREGLNYLLTVQATNGVFPFPDLRGKDPFFGPMLEQYASQHPDAIQDGWLIRDDNDGGLQFDNGVCGNAMLEGYNLLHERKYLESALRAADWAAAHPLVANFNYNSFSVWLLAAIFQETHERRYLDSALQKARLGVLPGEMENGRWLDPHNARPAYHWIMVRALLELYVNLPHGDAFRTQLRRSLFSAIDNGAGEIVDHGAPSLETPLAVLPLACEMEGAKPEWTVALNGLINEVFFKAQNDPRKIAGISPYSYGSYLLFRTREGGD